MALLVFCSQRPFVCLVHKMDGSLTPGRVYDVLSGCFDPSLTTLGVIPLLPGQRASSKGRVLRNVLSNSLMILLARTPYVPTLLQLAVNICPLVYPTARTLLTL